MRVLLINDYAVPVGGAEIFMLDLRKALRERGHDARLFSSNARPDSMTGFADYECLGTTSRFRTLLQTANPSAFLQLRRILAQFRPDVVHVRMFLTQLSPLILPLLKTVPSLYDVVWYRPICPTGTKLLPDRSICHTPPGAVCYTAGCLPARDWLPLMIQMKLWRRWRKCFNYTIANSESLKHRLIAEGIQPVNVFRHGVPVSAQRPPLSLPPEVAFAGRLVREKGIDVLLQAFAQVIAHVPGAKLLLAGEGPERERVIHLLDELKLAPHVSMAGYLSREEMEIHFKSAWVQVVPSIWEEPFGLVAAEAMMRGTAVIASRSGGLAEIIQHGKTGLLVRPDDSDALAKALVTVLSNREFAEQLGRAGREKAYVDFSEVAYVDEIIRCYHTLARS